MHVIFDQLGNHLFMGGAQGQFVVTAVGQGKEHLALGDVPAGLLPQLKGLKHGHHQFLPAGFIHLIADDILNLVQRPPGKGQVRINP